MNSDTNDTRPEIDMLEVIRTKFIAGEGVITISATMPDAAILLTIKQAVSFGKPFTVVPVVTPVDDSHFCYSKELADAEAVFRAAGALGPFNK